MLHERFGTDEFSIEQASRFTTLSTPFAASKHLKRKTQAVGDTYARSTIAVATPSAKPSMLKLIWQEGIRKKS